VIAEFGARAFGIFTVRPERPMIVRHSGKTGHRARVPGADPHVFIGGKEG